MNCYDTPILLISFNRPAIAQRVFDEIKKGRRRRFFMFVDGPHEEQPKDAGRCQITGGIGCIIKQ